MFSLAFVNAQVLHRMAALVGALIHYSQVEKSPFKIHINFFFFFNTFLNPLPVHEGSHEFSFTLGHTAVESSPTFWLTRHSKFLLRKKERKRERGGAQFLSWTSVFVLGVNVLSRSGDLPSRQHLSRNRSQTTKLPFLHRPAAKVTQQRLN